MIDAKGVIRWKSVGVDEKKLDAALELCLKDLDPNAKIEHGDKDKDKEKDKK